MRDNPLGAILRSALLAGIVAGLAAALFHFLATEPVIDRAITLETLRKQSEGVLEEPVVSRGAQQLGLFVGLVLYGLTWSLLFGALFHLAQRWLPAWSVLKRGLFLALAAYWSVALFPFLKYPANPPGVGDPETITYRQGLYFGVLVLSVLGVALAIGAWGSKRVDWRAALGGLSVFALIVYVVLPANPDAIDMPMQTVMAFRGLSIAGLTLFWVVFGLTFGALLTRAAAHAKPRTRDVMVSALNAR